MPVSLRCPLRSLVHGLRLCTSPLHIFACSAIHQPDPLRPAAARSNEARPQTGFGPPYALLQGRMTDLPEVCVGGACGWRDAARARHAPSNWWAAAANSHGLWLRARPVRLPKLAN